VSQTVPEAWARRGAETDVVYIARLYGVMQPDMRSKFATDMASLSSTTPVDTVAASGECNDLTQAIVRLLQMYAGSSQKLAVMEAAVQCVAFQRIRSGCKASLHDERVYDWLTEVAQSSFPHDNDVSTLMSFVADRHCDGYRLLLVDGWLQAVLCTSDGEFDAAESIYISYEYTRSTELLGYEMPEPAQFLNVRVDKQDFSDFDFETGWSLDQKAYDLEVRHQCVLKFTSFVAWWRSRFFERVLLVDAM
jgi:hypothetical protein